MPAPPKRSSGYATAMNIKQLHYLFLAALMVTACQTQSATPTATAAPTATQPVAASPVSPTLTETATLSPSETPSTEPTMSPSLLPTIFLHGSPVPLTTEFPPGLVATGGAPLPGANNGASLAPLAIKDLAMRLNVAESEIKIVKVENVDWPDPSLGLPEPGRFYAQVITPGQRILLSYAGKTYEYRAGSGLLKYAGEVQP